jgi:hypothetical protein
MEALHECALAHPEIALITQETSAADLEFTDGDVVLWFGAPPQGIQNYAASLGEDEIAIIAGAEVAQRNLSSDQLRALYTEPNPTYQMWTYTEGNELRTIFDATVLGGTPPSSYLLLALNPAAMLEAVTDDPMAVGYIPKSWLRGDVQTIAVERELQQALKQPILALTTTEPEGNLKNYLICLQQGANP